MIFRWNYIDSCLNYDFQLWPMMNSWTMNLARLCLYYENDVYDNRVFLDEIINVVVKGFLIYEYDHELWKVILTYKFTLVIDFMHQLQFNEIFYVFILRCGLVLFICLSYAILIFDFYILHWYLDLAPRGVWDEC